MGSICIRLGKRGRDFALMALTSLALVATTGLPQPAGAQPAAPAGAANLTADQWREDLVFLAAEVERRHANAFHTVSRDRFHAAIAALDARIPQLDRNQIIVEMMRIVAMIGDGHTRIDPRKDPRFGFPSLPLALYLFEDGLYVRAAAPAQAALVGARIEAIGGVPVDEAIRRVSALVSRDNEIGPRLFVPLYLNMPDILQALGLSERRDAATLRLSRGERTWTATVPAGEVAPLWPPDTDISLSTPVGWIDARTTPQPPLWLQAPLDYHRMIELPEQHALYIQLNMVTNAGDQTLEDFGEHIRERTAALNPRALILDLRLNQGGNGELRHPFVRSLIKAEDEDTRLFVLTWRGTFSASQFILDDLDRLTDAVVIGEPASSRPTGYGDAYRTTLPNSGIALRTSILFWQQGQNRDPWTWVDLSVPYRFVDYAAGRDPVLAAALDYRPPPPLHVQLLAAYQAGGTAALRRAMDDYRGLRANYHANNAARFMEAAQHLSQENGEVALSIAEFTERYYPQNLFASLIHALLAERAGQVETARQAATRALAIDPNNRFARSLLDRLAAAPSG